MQSKFQEAMSLLETAFHKLNEVKQEMEWEPFEIERPPSQGRKKYFTEEERKAANRKAANKYYHKKMKRMEELQKELEELKKQMEELFHFIF